MSLDLRIPMGLMFTLAGMILSAFGLSTRGNVALYAKSLGIDANLWWGLVLLVFGVTMLLLGQRGQRRIEKERQLPPAKGEARRGH
jgi:membrane protein implicated in regulation of membrane protease activity